MFSELAKERILVDFNLFAEQHGKNLRDNHFAAISSFLRPQLLEKKLTCSQDIVNNIICHQNFTNNYNQAVNKIRSKNGSKLLPIIDTRAYVFKIHPSKFHSFREINGMKTYYNLHNDENFELKSKVLSDNSSCVSLKYREIAEIDYVPKLKTLQKKIINIRNLTRLKIK